MTKKERITGLMAALRQEYPLAECTLAETDPWRLLVQVRLAAQCTDARVNMVTPALFQAAPNPRAMVELGWQEVRRYIATCGLTETKARRIVETSRLLLERHGGAVPSSFEELEALPGVGHKTASVVMNQAFGHPAFPVDTHIFRLARRWGLSRGSTVERVEADLKKAFPMDTWGRVHIQFVLWGRTYCPARGCNPACPICAQLGAR